MPSQGCGQPDARAGACGCDSPWSFSGRVEQGRRCSRRLRRPPPASRRDLSLRQDCRLPGPRIARPRRFRPTSRRGGRRRPAPEPTSVCRRSPAGRQETDIVADLGLEAPLDLASLTHEQPQQLRLQPLVAERLPRQVDEVDGPLATGVDGMRFRPGFPRPSRLKTSYAYSPADRTPRTRRDIGPVAYRPLAPASRGVLRPTG